MVGGVLRQRQRRFWGRPVSGPEMGCGPWVNWGRVPVREGFHADLVVMDLKRVRDKATAFDPHQISEGFDYVLVGGRFVVEDGKPTGTLLGRVLGLPKQNR